MNDDPVLHKVGFWGKRGAGNSRSMAAKVRFSTTRVGIPQASLWMECENGARLGVIPGEGRVMVCQAQSDALMNRVPKTAKWQFQSELDGFSTFPARTASTAVLLIFLLI